MKRIIGNRTSWVRAKSYLGTLVQQQQAARVEYTSSSVREKKNYEHQELLLYAWRTRTKIPVMFEPARKKLKKAKKCTRYRQRAKNGRGGCGRSRRFDPRPRTAESGAATTTGAIASALLTAAQLRAICADRNAPLRARRCWWCVVRCVCAPSRSGEKSTQNRSKLTRLPKKPETSRFGALRSKCQKMSVPHPAR